MTQTDDLKHLPEFIEKMEKEGLDPVIIDTFSHYYRKVVTGETGMIRNRDIEPLSGESIPRLDELSAFKEEGEKAISKTVRIILNGGLGTSMGLTGPKSLLEARQGKSFLSIIVERAAKTSMQLAFMNSFNTHRETEAALGEYDFSPSHISFLQHKFPKILQKDLCPATWLKDPDLEWNPPGHGDIYSALYTSETLSELTEKGYEYAFISNCDNLGADMDNALLGYFAQKRFPFMMEVCRRTPADMKGGHIARKKEGGLVLRESAQCPEEEMDAFQNIDRFRYFNTNNLWINLLYLDDMIKEKGKVLLPMILNPKTLDPRDKNTPKVFQVETAMGAAISLFEGSAAVEVPRTRFFPVKKCNDLLILRSDCFKMTEDKNLVLNPERNQKNDLPLVKLDEQYYKYIDAFNARFPEGPPSLIGCESLQIEGDIRFEKNISVTGRVKIKNTAAKQKVIREGTILDADITF